MSGARRFLGGLRERIAGVDDANRPTGQVGCFARYTTTEHADILKTFPELTRGGLVFVKDTYEEASAAAALSVLRTLAYTGWNVPVRIIYHPHNESSSDPMDLVGSWGWKTAG